MAETMSIRDRIASLNLAHVGQASQTPRPPVKPRSQSTSNRCLEYEGDMTAPAVGNQPIAATEQPAPTRPESKAPLPPTLPPRRASQVAPARPPLPPRNTSQASTSQASLRPRDSSESISSTHSALSTLSAITSTSNSTASRRLSTERRASNVSARLPPPFDPAALPPLPPKRPEPKRPPLGTVRSYSSIKEDDETPALHSSRTPAPINRASSQTCNFQSPTTDGSSRLAHATLPKKSPLAYALNKSTEMAPPIPSRQFNTATSSNDIGAPPIPVASRPSLNNIQAARPSATQSLVPLQRGARACLKCRDFKAPDSHAAKFARQSIPSTDTAWLSHQLTSPFSSPTDRARVIFTWLHHNIAYNTTAFFSGRHQSGDPAATMSTGLAVCEGYAGLFTALAIHAGLECIVVGGHGKGFGHSPLKPGDPVPPYAPDGHAWNAVKIDDDEWKLIDPCWGAGAIRDDQTYLKRFAPEFFSMDNDEFGLRHFPKDQNHFFRSDGRPMTWHDYMIGESGPGEDVTVYTGCDTEHGLSPKGFVPKKKHIRVRGANPKGRVQFQFQKICEHWDNRLMGKGRPYVYVLAVGGKDGRKREEIPFTTNGQFWWVDVAVEDLGCSGQTVHCYAVTSIDGKDGRGLTNEEFKRAKRSYKGMGFGGVAAWQLV